jgi:hypothetical protein
VTAPDERIPPHDLDAEGAVLGALLSDSSFSVELEPRHFYSDANRWIYQACRELDGTRDLPGVASWLHDRNRLEQVGGSAYLVQLLDAPVVLAEDLPRHATRIRELWSRRELRSLGSEVSALSGELESTDLLARINQRIETIGESYGTKSNRLDARAIFEPLPPIPWVCQPLDLVPGPPALMAGYGYSGKTAAAQAMALSVAAHKPIWGCFEARHGKVLHADYEQGGRLTKARYQRLAFGMEIDPTELFPDWLEAEILGPYLTDPHAEDYWCRACEGKTLWILDSLRALAPGLDENSSEFRRILDMCFRISERTECSVLVITHARKSSNNDGADGREQLRGSSAIFDAASSVLLLELVKSGQVSGVMSADWRNTDTTVHVSHEKARTSGRAQAPFSLRFVDVQEGDDLHAGLVILAEPEPSKEALRAKRNSALDSKVLQAVTEHPNLSCRELSAVLDCAWGRPLQQALDRLHLQGKVRLVDGPRRAKLWLPCQEEDPT